MGEGGDDEEPSHEVDVGADDRKDGQGEGQGQEEAVVAEVQGDPDDDGDDGPPEEGALEEGRERRAGDRLLRRQVRGLHRLLDDAGEHLGRFRKPPVAGVVERALRDHHPREEGDERGERRHDEQDAPRVDARDGHALDQEHPPERNREQEADRPEEVEEDHEPASRLGREELG